MTPADAASAMAASRAVASALRSLLRKALLASLSTSPVRALWAGAHSRAAQMSSAAQGLAPAARRRGASYTLSILALDIGDWCRINSPRLPSGGPASRASLRQLLLAQRKAWFTREQVQPQLAALSAHLLDALRQLEPACLGLYWPFEGELDTVRSRRTTISCMPARWRCRLRPRHPTRGLAPLFEIVRRRITRSIFFFLLGSASCSTAPTASWASST